MQSVGLFHSPSEQGFEHLMAQWNKHKFVEKTSWAPPPSKKNIIGPKWRKAVSLDGGWHHLCIFEESGPNVWWAGRVASGKLEPWQQKHTGKNWYLQVLRGGCCCCFCCWVGGWVVCFPEIPVCEDEDLSSNDALGDPRIERYSSTGGLLGQVFFFKSIFTGNIYPMTCLWHIYPMRKRHICPRMPVTTRVVTFFIIGGSQTATLLCHDCMLGGASRIQICTW